MNRLTYDAAATDTAPAGPRPGPGVNHVSGRLYSENHYQRERDRELAARGIRVRPPVTLAPVPAARPASCGKCGGRSFYADLDGRFMSLWDWACWWCGWRSRFARLPRTRPAPDPVPAHLLPDGRPGRPRKDPA